MLIEVRVKTRSSRKRVERLSDKVFKVYTQKPAVDGQANSEVIEILAGYFGCRPNRVSILRGVKSGNKIIRIDRQA